MLPLFLLTLSATLSTMAAPPVIPLWEGEPPNHRPSDAVETAVTEGGITRIAKVQRPTLELHLPAGPNATGKAVVVCPGGGYRILAYNWEGTDIAAKLNANGIAALVLKYRLPEAESNLEPRLSPLLDAQRALRLARANAEDWGFEADQIGLMGFSAGGHLASTLGTQFDAGDPEHADPVERLSSRPDFLILAYPVITMHGEFGHSGSRQALLGETPSPELARQYSGELNVTPDTPPTFLVHSADDQSVPVKNSLVFYEALLANGVEAEMHLYPYGGHGYSLAIGRGRLQGWSDRCIDWINERP